MVNGVFYRNILLCSKKTVSLHKIKNYTNFARVNPKISPHTVLSSIIKWYMLRRIDEIEYFKKEPLLKQKETLFDLLHEAEDTVFGKAHHFQDIRSAEQYRAAVPIRDYEAHKPYIERVLRGEQNILWGSEIKWFAKSSGTTSDKSKFIPISKESRNECHYRGGRDALALYCQAYPDTQIFEGKGIVLGGSHEISHFNETLRYGDLSAVLLQNMSPLARYLSSLDMDVALMSDWEQKIERIIDASLGQNITFLAGVPTWMVSVILRIFERSGANNLADIFPNLELYLHGGVSFTPYRAQFAQQLIRSPKMHYWETYNASEGFFAVQDEPERNDMLLMLDYGIYYEFVPLDDFLSNPQAAAVGLEAVVLDKNYVLLISTNTGLWRYVVGDTVRFTSLFPFRIQVSGRVKSFINAFGEEVMVDNADRAIAEACRKSGALVSDYTVAPIYLDEHGKGGHQWLVEFSQEPDSLAHFVEVLDQTLQTINSDYEAKRQKDIVMQLPLVQAIPAGTFYRWLKMKGKAGGQHKVPRLANERQYVDEITELLKSGVQ